MKWLLIVTFLALTACAQENYLPNATLSVVGTLRQTYSFPWTDGWNERGYIQVERVLHGPAKPGAQLPFAWEHNFGGGSCIRPDWRGAAGERGLWFLEPDGKRWRAPDWFSGIGDNRKIYPK